MARVLFFGKLGDLAGGRERDIPLRSQDKTVSELVAAISEAEPDLAAALNETSVRVIINEQMADTKTAISDGDEIAFLPPVSGG